MVCREPAILSLYLDQQGETFWGSNIVFSFIWYKHS